MNILLAGLYYPGSFSMYLANSLRNLGNDVTTFNTNRAPRWITLGRISVPVGKNISIQELIINCKSRPDLIIQTDGALRHLAGYRKTGIPKVFCAIDSHLTTNFHLNIINDFDIILSSQKDYIPVLKKVKENVFWLPLAIDPTVHKKYETNRLFDIGFVGRMDPMYASRIELLKKLSAKYDVLAANDLKYTNVSKIYSQCRIGFNKSLRGDLNLRVFEIMSCGTMLLTDKINAGIEELFIDKKHLVLYKDEKEMLELVGYYLENVEEREKIAEEGQKEVLNKHTHEHRVKEMLRIVEKYI